MSLTVCHWRGLSLNLGARGRAGTSRTRPYVLSSVRNDSWSHVADPRPNGSRCGALESTGRPAGSAEELEDDDDCMGEPEAVSPWQRSLLPAWAMQTKFLSNRKEGASLFLEKKFQILLADVMCLAPRYQRNYLFSARLVPLATGADGLLGGELSRY